MVPLLPTPDCRRWKPLAELEFPLSSASGSSRMFRFNSFGY